MSYFDRTLTSWMSSLYETLEDNNQTRVRLWVAAGGLVATAVVWIVHLSVPDIAEQIFEADSKFAMLFLFGVTVAPPFAVAFSLGSLLMRRRTEPVADESGPPSGPMSGYFYREQANREWKLLIVAGLFGGLNFLLIVITTASA
ncbi:MAG TPA: hypothetical protein VJS17_06535 [Pyrinomonadaceae bacterium]|nr:hypothetical protein [Pyrinomonadaceae bacterium]